MKRPRRIGATSLSRLLLLLLVLWISSSCSCCCHASSRQSWASSSVVAGAGPTRRRGQSQSTVSFRRRSFGVAAGVPRTTTTSRHRWVTPAAAHASTTSTLATTRPSGDFPEENDEATFEQLGPIGKVVAGTIEIAFSTLMEFVSGFVGGYVLGTLTGLPAFVTKPATTAASASFWSQFQQRAIRMHGRSYKWASSWGGISAAFGGFRVTTKVLRGGKEDEWSTVFSSMAAGAYFARKGGFVMHWFLSFVLFPSRFCSLVL